MAPEAAVIKLIIVVWTDRQTAAAALSDDASQTTHGPGEKSPSVMIRDTNMSAPRTYRGDNAWPSVRHDVLTCLQVV